MWVPLTAIRFADSDRTLWSVAMQFRDDLLRAVRGTQALQRDDRVGRGARRQPL